MSAFFSPLLDKVKSASLFIVLPEVASLFIVLPEVASLFIVLPLWRSGKFLLPSRLEFNSPCLFLFLKKECHLS